MTNHLDNDKSVELEQVVYLNTNESSKFTRQFRFVFSLFFSDRFSKLFSIDASVRWHPVISGC